MEYCEYYEPKSPHHENIDGFLWHNDAWTFAAQSGTAGNARRCGFCCQSLCLLISAHAHDLRAEVKTDFNITTDREADIFVHQIAVDWQKASLSTADQALCRFAEKLTLNPRQMTETDIETLRSFGFNDAAIHDATQVISYFNYINRIADALNVDLEKEVKPWEVHPDLWSAKK